MSRRPEIGNITIYPQRPLKKSDTHGYVLKFYCPIVRKRIRRSCGTRDRREARRIMRECRERLLDGKYIESGGAITEQHEMIEARVPAIHAEEPSDLSWQECFERYNAHRKNRVREKTQADSRSRIEIAERILEGRCQDKGEPRSGSIVEFTTLESMEYLQDRLLDGDECRYDSRSPVSVNSMMAAVMAFVRYCHKHGWIDRVPMVSKLEATVMMKGRPITESEFGQMLEAVPQVVGKGPADSWNRVLNVLWETAFRVGDLMDFSWNDRRHIHPIWPEGAGEHPTIGIAPSQKNKKMQVIPMLPGLHDLLTQTPLKQRIGWVVNPRPLESTESESLFRPSVDELQILAGKYSNSAIARACNVSETTIRKWLQSASIGRFDGNKRRSRDIPTEELSQIQKNASQNNESETNEIRLSKERVGRIISMIGETAGIVVQEEDKRNSKRLKYASAHDIRRGCAKRLINVGITAETLKLVLRHDTFSTTERFYGAIREAQSAAKEIYDRLAECNDDSTLRRQATSPLSSDEIAKLRALLNSI